MPYHGLAPDFTVQIVPTTASTTLVPADHGKFFTNKGAAGAVVFTLPPIANVYAGWWAEFYCAADQTITITAPSGKLIAFNNAAATSLAFSTASEKIGGYIKVIYDGALYMTIVGLGIETQTPVVS